MGKEEDFTTLIQQHEGIIFKITTMYARSEHDQKDLYQDIVYQLWKSFDSFREEARFSTWMYRVSMNTAITHRKVGKRVPASLEMDRIVLEYTESTDKEFEEKLRTLYAHIYRLNDLEKGLILLLLEGKSYQEIAEISGLSATNVGTRLSRIRRKLKSRMNKS